MTDDLLGMGIDAETEAPVWVLDDPDASSAAQALGIAERLGTPFRRIPLAWSWLGRVAPLSSRGSLIGLAASGHAAGEPASLHAGRASDLLAGERPPILLLSAGYRAAAVAVWLKQRRGAPIVHCGPAGPLAGRHIDLTVVTGSADQSAAGRVVPVLGEPSRVSPLLLRQAGRLWQERLEHMPRPRIALITGGPPRGAELSPALAHDLGRRVARLAGMRGGSVLAATGRRTGAEATEALAAGLSPVISPLHRWGEPGDDPTLAYLALADAIVVTAELGAEIAQACTTAAGVYVALPGLASLRQRRAIERLVQADQVRWLDDRIAPWSREPLDEAGRVAAEIRRRFRIE